MIKIPDISFYQYGWNGATIDRYVDFEKMREQTPAVIIRAGQNLWKDRAFDVSWKGAKEAGLLRGSYWFYDSRADPKKQADLWFDILNGDFGELHLWCDFEDRYGGQWHGWRHWYDFMERVQSLMPLKEIGIYTGYYYWKENTSPPLCTVSQREYFNQYPLWIANYNPIDNPPVPEPFDNWLMWQYTDNGNGSQYGVASGNIDLNYCKLDLIPSPPVGSGYKIIANFGDTKVEYKGL